MELSDNELQILNNRITNILHGNYNNDEKHVLAIRLESNLIVKKFLELIQYDSIAEKYEILTTKLLDSLEY
jgi:hypothetical protein